MTQPIEVEELFERTLEFPDDDARERYNALVGLEDAKARLCKEALIRLHPGRLSDWVATHHNGSLTAARAPAARPPVFIFAGDVGTGKTALAETFGSAIAESSGLPVFCYRLSLATRGTGMVGQITTLVQSAFCTH